MRILITGGAGFIGSHLAEACIRDGHNVCILDDLSSGSLENVAHLVGNPRFRGVIGNIQDAELVGKQMDECDIVYHLAAAIGMKLILAQPLQTIETNVRGTEIVLAQAALRNKRLLFASTSEVYGLNEHKPSLETDNVVIGAPSKARDRPFIQYGRNAPDRTLRHGGSNLHQAGAVRRAFDSSRGRPTDALLRGC